MQPALHTPSHLVNVGLAVTTGTGGCTGAKDEEIHLPEAFVPKTNRASGKVGITLEGEASPSVCKGDS